MTSRSAAPPPTRRTRPRALGPLFLTICPTFALLLCPPLLHRAAGQTPTEPFEETVRVETNLVSVPAYVTDERGRRVGGLAATDFSVRDEGTEVRLAYFAAGAERVALAFLLDASGSIRDVYARQRETARALLERFGGNSRFAVLFFSDAVQTVVPFTRERAQAEEALRAPVAAGRRTAIFDAALAAVRAFRAPGGAEAERRIVILISDGLDTASIVRPRLVFEEARAAGVTFYVVHLPLYAPRDGRLAPRPTPKSFLELAKQTGGQFFTLGDERASLDPRARPDLGPIFQAIAEDLRGQYVLGFYADEAARRERQRARRIDVRLAAGNRRKLRVRALRETYMLGDIKSVEAEGQTRP